MNVKNTTNEIPDSRGAWRETLRLAADACVFAFTIFKGVEYTLLHAEGVIGAGSFAAGMVLVFAALAGLRWAHARAAGGRFVLGALVEWGVCALVFYAMARLSTVQINTQSFAWLPLEWHKLPANHWLLVRLTPWFAMLLAACVVGGIHLFVRRRRAVLLVLLAALVVLTFHQCRIMAKQGTLGVYLVMYVCPLLAVMAAAAMRRPRFGARALVLAAAALILLWHYIGWMPVMRIGDFEGAPGVTRIYPRDGQQPEFPLAFFRDFQVDPDQRFLYTAYGPTSGIIRMDLKTGDVLVLETWDELVRFLTLFPERDELAAIDWMNSDLLTLSMSRMKILKREDMYFKKERLYVPLHPIAHAGRLYVTYTERPGLAEFSLRPLRLRRSLNLRRAGFTKFRSGAWKAALDPRGGYLFSEVGMVDTSDTFRLVRVNLETFKADAAAVMPEGGLELLALPQKRRIIATSFFSDRLYEFDMDTMKRTRVIRGPLSCRNLVYDARRDRLIGTGFLNGELRIMDYASGRTLHRTRVGNKAASLYLAPGGDMLYLGSARGVFRVDLNKYRVSD